jgi:hypothetical protein
VAVAVPVWNVNPSIEMAKSFGSNGGSGSAEAVPMADAAAPIPGRWPARRADRLL